VSDLIRKKNGIRERNVDRMLGGKEVREQFWIILEEGLFDFLGSSCHVESEESERGDEE